jgi:MoxR-like ATPase
MMSTRDQILELQQRMSRSIIGQEHVVERLLIGLLANGNLLLEGLPGLAKTRAVKAMASNLAADLSRIQFTPDLLPSDITGTEVYHQADGKGEFRFEPGPLFANLVLADEINRAPAKVQSALLEAMQEKQVTIGDTTYKLPSPFLVMATQNPIEQEGTYPLPEAQLDRFMLMLRVGYPSKQEERQIMDRMTGTSMQELQKVIDPEQLISARDVINQIYIDEKIRDYIVDVVSATRQPKDYGLDAVADFIEFGASPRASIFLNLASRAHAFLQHRGFVTPEDIKSIGADVLRHRVILTYEAEAEEITTEDVIQRLFDHVEIP